MSKGQRGKERQRFVNISTRVRQCSEEAAQYFGPVL